MAKLASPPELRIVGETYYVFWRDPFVKRTRRASLRTRDPIEAIKAFAEFIRQLGGDPDEPECITVGEAIDFYLDEHVRQKSLAVSTVEFRLARVREVLGPVILAAVDVETSRNYLATRTAAGVTPGTVRGELAYLVAAANHCVRWKHIIRAQLPTVELPPAAQPRERWLTFDELERLMEAAAKVWDAETAAWRAPREGDRLPRIHRFIELAYYTAGRKEAIETLQWDTQIDFLHGFVRLNPPGRRQTRKRRSMVPLHPKLLPTLERAFQERTGPHVLDSSGSIRKAFGSAVTRAGLGEDVTPHVLRHTRATHLALRGIALQDIADLLGDTLEVVEHTYRHLSPEHLRSKLENV